MVRSEDNGTSDLVRLHEDRREELDGIDSPRNLHLFRLGEVVIHGVQDHTDNAPLTVSERLAYGRRKSFRRAFREVAFVKQERWPAWSRDSHQAGMLGKGGLLGRAASRFDLSRKERHPRELRDGRKYRQHGIGAGHALSTPSALLQALAELVKDARIHAVKH